MPPAYRAAVISTEALGSIAGIAGVALLMALGAQVSVALPGSPVPISLQSLVAVTALFTARRILLCGLPLYLLLGALGLPVFADFSGGAALLRGPSGGYLLAMCLLLPLAAPWVRRRDTGRPHAWPIRLVLALAAHTLILVIGAAWLQHALAASWADALAWGVVPFLSGAVVKSVLAATLATR